MPAGRPSVPFCAYAATWIALLPFMRHLLQLRAYIIANVPGLASLPSLQQEDANVDGRTRHSSEQKTRNLGDRELSRSREIPPLLPPLRDRSATRAAAPRFTHVEIRETYNTLLPPFYMCLLIERSFERSAAACSRGRYIIQTDSPAAGTRRSRSRFDLDPRHRVVIYTSNNRD